MVTSELLETLRRINIGTWLHIGKDGIEEAVPVRDVCQEAADEIDRLTEREQSLVDEIDALEDELFYLEREAEDLRNTIVELNAKLEDA